MAKRRDYRAEEARRNERSRAAGFSSRAQERRYRNESQRWSYGHSEKSSSTYSGGESPEWVHAYHEAYVEQYSDSHSEHLDKLYHFIVEVGDYMDADEFWQTYGRSE